MQFIQIGELMPNDEYVLRFKAASLQELVAAYNREVGCCACVSVRGRYLVALYQELKRRPVDISVIDTGQGLRVDHHVRLDPSGRQLILEPQANRGGWRRILDRLVRVINRHL